MSPSTAPPDDAAALRAIADFLAHRALIAKQPASAELSHALAERLRTAAGVSGYRLDRPDRVTALVDGLGVTGDRPVEHVTSMNELAGWLVFAARTVTELGRLGAALALALAVGVRMEVAKAAATTPQSADGVAAPGSLAARAIDRIAQVRTARGSGTAFCVGVGEWLTAEHVISGAKAVRLFNGSMRSGERAEIRSFDSDADVALLGAHVGVEKLELADAAPLPGTPVWTFGFGMGLMGVDAAVRRGVVSERFLDGGQNHIRTDAATNPGDSGGPLLNDWGEVVGMHLSSHRGATGAHYALAADSLRALLPRLRGAGP